MLFMNAAKTISRVSISFKYNLYVLVSYNVQLGAQYHRHCTYTYIKEISDDRHKIGRLVAVCACFGNNLLAMN